MPSTVVGGTIDRLDAATGRPTQSKCPTGYVVEATKEEVTGDHGALRVLR